MRTVPPASALLTPAQLARVRTRSDAWGGERMSCAPYWVNYHLEHHLLMWVPCYRLPLLRRFLLANGYGSRIETAPGYLAVLRKVTLDAPDAPRSGRRRASGTFAQGFEAV